ncbi:unnamed protein product [Closterium sp. Naga37s-1]|nr:unnamed protein product [Closterium sp. Naga37s-1]
MGHHRDRVSTLCFPSSSATCSTIGVVLLVLYFVALGPSLKSPISSPSFDAKELHKATEVSDSAVRGDEVGARLSGLDPEEPWQQNQQEQQSQQYQQGEQDEKNRQDQKEQDAQNRQDEKDQQNERGQTATPRLETQEERQKREQELLQNLGGKDDSVNLKGSIKGTPSKRTKISGSRNDGDARNPRASSSRKGGGLNSEACEGRKVYLYNLPSKLNSVLLEDCLDTNIKGFCATSRHGGLGTRLPPWDDSFEGKERSSRSADFLFIPAYLGWSIWSLVEHGLFEKRDDPVIELERYLLEENADFKRLVNRGDHVLVLGRPIWDFKRDLDKPEGWGTDLWWRRTFKNVTLLTVEAPPEWYEREVFSVPYPTCFHPVGSAELQGWVRHVREQPRPYLYSFVGGKRAHATWEGSLRGVLLNDCENDPKRCIFLECTVADAEAATAAAAEIGRQAQKRKEEGDSREGKAEENEIEPDFPLRGCMDPRRVAGVMLQSEFCLQPIGDSLTRRSFFDSIIAGCLPVVFAPGTFDYQYPWFFSTEPEARRNVSVMVPSDDVIGGKVRIGEVLGGISEERKREMREELYKHIPRLLLRDHTREGEVGEEGMFVDVVDRTIEGLIERKKMRRAGVAKSYFPL